MIRRPPRSTPLYSSAASDVYKRQASELSWKSSWSGQDCWTADQSFNSGFLNDRSSTGCITALTATHRHSGVDLDLGSSTCNPDRHLEADMGRPFYGGSLLAPGCECPQDDWTFNTAADTRQGDFAPQYADDTTLFLPSADDATSSLLGFSDAAASLGLKVSWAKTKLQNLGAGPPQTTSQSTVIQWRQ